MLAYSIQISSLLNKPYSVTGVTMLWFSVGKVVFRLLLALEYTAHALRSNIKRVYL
jgi:hypothetical protein